MARVKFSFTDNNGAVLTDSRTKQPHAFDFPVDDQVLAIVEAWNEKMGYKYPNFAEIAREVLFSTFKAMIPSEINEAFEEQKAAIDKAKEAAFWGFFGMTSPE